ncbi:hypothetical protein [Kingella negevensis]|uniref:hypothetical protein n=1 Tax=Kingella negevensis TaxID=1522312 RepID=UPI00050A2E7B|nr:hypothetical protein [Kingella negevensis]
MSELALLPVLGMNVVSRVDNLRREGGWFVRDVNNVDVLSDGRLSLRQGFEKMVDLPVRDVWQSPLHGDVFAVLGKAWGVLDVASGDFRALLDDVGSDSVCCVVLNNRVVLSCGRGVFVYDGVRVLPLGLDTPPALLVLPASGSLSAGSYGLAVAWLRDELEGGLSELASVDVVDGGLSFSLPLCLDKSVTGARVYMTSCNGGELLKLGDYALDCGVVSVVSMPVLGRAAVNGFMLPMPSGLFLQVWRGRLVVARKNVLYFSQSLAFHWHDARFDFVQLPQRVSFVVAVEGGLWVGQSTGVVFLSGSDLAGMQFVWSGAKSPVAGSGVLLPAEVVPDVSGGLPVAAWLAENGWVLGTAQGQLIERQAGVMAGVSGMSGQSVCVNRRLFGLVL